MVCSSLRSPEEVTACIYAIWPWASLLFAAVGLLLVLLNLGATSVVAYFLRNAKRHEAERDAAQLRYKELAEIVSGPLTRYQELVVNLQDANRKVEIAEGKQSELNLRIESYKASQGSDPSQASKAVIEAEARAQKSEDRLATIRKNANVDVDAFWARSVGRQPANYSELMKQSIPILLFANQKGGVGKTTVAANIAAYFQYKAGERVLAIDLDYQGSMTVMMTRQAGLEGDTFRSTVDLMFQNKLPENWRDIGIVTLNKKLHYMPCHYSFEKLERTLEYGWMIGEFEDDVRYRLARALLSPEIQSSYDRIIIDTPPRFTAGFINGFCASTHLFIPTIVDDPSLNAVGHFVAQYARLSKVVNPHLQLAGIVGVRTTNVQNNRLPETLQARADAADIAARNALGSKGDYFIRDAVVRNYPSLASAADQGIAYFKEETSRPMFDILGKRIGELAPRRKR